MIVEPVTLHGFAVRLEPMTADHVIALARVGLEPEIWRWGIAPLTTTEDMQVYVEQALEERRRGLSLPFVIVALPSGQVVGSTRYGNIDLVNRRLEIGWTWLAPAHQRTAINTEAKLLLLTHAFEQLRVHRVELKTDALNQKSRAAILRIGAVEEGTFRKHIVTASGRVRDSVYYSIIDTEWPTVKARLQGKLQ
jgi:RimJ/RimL family protein N-acetyltransferase